MPQKTVEVDLVANDVEVSVDAVLREVLARNEDDVILVAYTIDMQKAVAKLTFEAE